MLIGCSPQCRRMADHGAPFVGLFQIERRGDKPVLHHVEGHDGLDRAAGAHRMPHVSLESRDKGSAAVNRMDGLGFDDVAHLGARRMGADKIDLIGGQGRILEGRGGGFR